MKPSLLSAFLLCVALGVAGCAPSPYYKGTKGFAPGAVPRDGMGRPVLNGRAIEYTLPPPSATGQSTTGAAPSVSNPIIYFEDLSYADRPSEVDASVREQALRP